MGVKDDLLICLRPQQALFCQEGTSTGTVEESLLSLLLYPLPALALACPSCRHPN